MDMSERSVHAETRFLELNLAIGFVIMFNRLITVDLVLGLYAEVVTILSKTVLYSFFFKDGKRKGESNSC